jgi:protein NrfC
MDDHKAAVVRGVTRKEFLKGLGSGLVVAGVFSAGGSAVLGRGRTGQGAIPLSQGYLLVDSLKCAGCRTCMMACSLTHEGKENPTLSRIRVLENTFGHYPNDIATRQCRQCVRPECLLNCPTGALHVDEGTGVRMVNQAECIGCQQCSDACPFTPSRPVWDAARQVSTKCDLCLETPYWDEQGGPGGKQACVELCPMKAIQFTSVVPSQLGDAGYDVNLRLENYLRLTAVEGAG